MAELSREQQRIVDLRDTALHHLQADGAIDRAGLYKIIRKLADAALTALSDDSVRVPREKLKSLIDEARHQSSMREDYQEWDTFNELADSLLAASEKGAG